MASITFKHVNKTYPGNVTVVPDLNLEIQISRLDNLAQRYDGGCQYAELLISNYDTSERLQAVRQLSLFDDETDNLEV